MLKKYSIWDKKSNVITPIGEVLTPEEWIDRYPVAKIESIKIVCSAGEINGGFFGTLGQMVQMYTEAGADFSGAITDEEKLEVIESFEDSRNAGDGQNSPEERIASALEFQNLMSLPTEHEDDPDED